MEYDPAHKTSSVTSITSNMSLPSLCTGRADSISSAFEFDELQEPPFEEGFSFDEFNNNIMNNSDFLNSLLKEKEQENISHEMSCSLTESTDNDNTKKRARQQDCENLTEDQKRINHIASEQKRRSAIRGGFKELTELIPTLKNINNSKSTILFKSVEYIKQLDKRNKSLKDKLLVLQQKVIQKHKKQQHLHPSAVAALVAHKNQQKQLELLQHQLLVQQALLNKHNISTGITAANYHSISIPAMDETPTTSALNSPTLHSSLLPVNNNNSIHHLQQDPTTPALVMPASFDEWFHLVSSSSTATLGFIIPADEPNQQDNTFHRERLLTSGKLNHLI